MCKLSVHINSMVINRVTEYLLQVESICQKREILKVILDSLLINNQCLNIRITIIINKNIVIKTKFNLTIYLNLKHGLL